MDIVERLLSRIKVNAAGCFEWQGYRTPRGYGMLSVGNKTRQTHRVSFATFRREIPDLLCVCHRCDNPCCINPAHLFLGTNKDNTLDAVAKDRMASGERSPRSRLTESTALQACSRYQSGSTAAQIAAEMGVSENAVLSLLNGRTWKRLGVRVEMRNPHRPGSGSPVAKLTEADVLEIRAMRIRGVKVREIADLFGVRHSNVSLICARKTWTHV